ncbi:hypothetical protein BRADI_3g54234v3 [Brachypodium distachyon]|uniref:Uncharacterized protein n=1 Tax=Brachypodium distachyon TaxID=15368 RepID=A0A0Q3JRS7_BRADI|nr:hypothetical protein BRADI_3g54234v3 [Brachypodium distachyon]
MSPLLSGFGTRPWLVQVARGGHQQTFVDSSDGTAHAVAVPKLRGKTCLGCVHGGDWLLMLDESTADCFLLRLTPDDGDPSLKASNNTIVPPPPLREPLESIGTCATLESPSHLREFTVVVAINASPPIDDEEEDGLEQSSSILFCRPGDAEWAHDRVPTHRLVESRGKIFAVATEQFRLHGREDGTPTRVAVYRLSLRDMEWKRVNGIGAGRAFVVSGNYAFSVEAGGEEAGEEKGLVRQGNCVYLMASSCDCERLYKFCLDDMTISFRKILWHPTEPWSRAFWAVPLPPHNGDEGNRNLLRRGVRGGGGGDVQLELLELVVSNLSLVDRLRFPAVCKSWKKVCNPVQGAKVWPWLMHSSGQDGKCKFFDPLRCQENDARFPVAYANPVWFRGKYYCLRRMGNLGTFDPASNEWTVMEKPGPINVLMHLLGDNHEGRDFCYLVEVRGELVSVFVRNSDLPPRVFKLDEASMAWVEVQEIGGAALFVDFRASYVVASPEGGYSEDGKRAAYYDMEARKYCPSFDGLKQPLHCVWVVPNLRYD